MSTRPAAHDSGESPYIPTTLSRKRSTSEAGADTQNSRSAKKSKTDDDSKSPDKKRKKRKARKRKSTVTNIDAKPRSLSKSRSATVATEDDAQVPPVAENATENLPEQDARPAGEPKDVDDVEDTEDMSDRIPYADKGKGKAGQEPLPPVIESPEAQIMRLQQELDAQRLLLGQHQTHLNQVHQALTCQICLDLMHKPFALAPCGHVVCYPCLVRWFTAPEAPGGPNNLEEEMPDVPGTSSHQHKKKNCPICRTNVNERPVEVWGIKSMVAGLVRSGLVELPAPLPEAEAGLPTNNSDDPWRNIFHRVNRRSFFDIFEPIAPRPPREGGEGQGLDQMGMYDAEDGGIYRCLDCMHEIWSGQCSHCHRVYPGHPTEDDEDSELDFDPGHIFHMFAHGQPMQNGRFNHDIDSDSEESVGMMFRDELNEDDERNEDRNAPHWRNRRLTHPHVHHPFNPLPPPAPNDEEREARNALDRALERDMSSEDDGSFIDDADQQSAPPSERPPHRPRRRVSREVVEISEDSGEDQVLVLHDSPPPHSFGSRRRRPIDLSFDIDDDDSDEEVVRTTIRRVGRRARLAAESASDESEHELEHRARPWNHPEPILLVEGFTSDEDEHDNDHDPRPVLTVNGFTSDEDELEIFSDDEVENEDDGEEDGDERAYEDDGSRWGPSSRSLRLIQGGDVDVDDDSEDGGDAY